MAAPKLQRWIDLLAALLRRRYAASFEELSREVPAYLATGNRESIRRKFERDKDELRAFGIPIRTVEGENGEESAYQLSARDFYLPYLTALLDGRPTKPRRVDRNGYIALRSLAFEPDELAAVVDAARRVRGLGDPVLAGHVRSAMRKLAHDLPLDVAVARDESVAYAATAAAQPDATIFERLDDALARRKRVSFDYFSMGAGGASCRTVEPYGLFFLGQHWYLAGREPEVATVKNYRVSRMSDLTLNAAQPGTPDYAIPGSFRLREHARSRHAWELGDGDAVEVTVAFRTDVGVAASAARLGAPVPGQAEQRSFQVRRLDAFVRWLLSLGLAARPVAPAALIEEYRRQAEATLAVYADTAGGAAS
jgi:proteasome accessory factor B